MKTTKRAPLTQYALAYVIYKVSLSVADKVTIVRQCFKMQLYIGTHAF